MVKSEQQKAVLELGKLLVKELDLEKSVDTLSRWMAHYVAEKIKYVESLPYGVKKKNAEKECFFLILDLWKHRWYYKSDRQPLRNFEALFSILQNLNPEKEEPYYFRLNNTQSEESNNYSFKPSDIKNSSTLALQIDKVARIWIDYLLREAATNSNNEQSEKIIDRAVKAPDSTDAHIIQIVLAGAMNDGDTESFDTEEWDRKSKINTLNKRIGELQKFKKVNKYLIDQFVKELKKITK